MARPAKLLTEDNLLKIKNDSFIGMIDTNYIQKEYSFSKKTAERAIKKLNLIHTDQYIINMIKEYLDGSTAQELAKKYNTSDVNINAILRRRNIERRGTSYIANYHYFDIIDTEDKAYFLGFIWADGCIRQVTKNSYQLEIGLKDTDIEVLHLFNKYMESSFPIAFYKQQHKNHNGCKLQITSTKIFNDLHKYGIVPNKTNSTNIPKNIPSCLMHHFIRGFFDGDGCIGVTDTGYPSILFATSKEMCEWLQKIFNFGNITKKTNSDICYSYDIHGREKCKIIFDFLYKDSSIYLKRKRNKFDIVKWVKPFRKDKGIKKIKYEK